MLPKRVEGSKRREDLDSEICEGLRQQVGDVGHTSAMMQLASGTQARPFNLNQQMLKRRSRSSEGGQIVRELKSIREGKVLGRRQRSMVGSSLDSEGAGGGDAAREGARDVWSP